MELLTRWAFTFALMAAGAAFWAFRELKQAQHGVGDKRLQDLRVVRVLKATDTEIAVLGHFASDPKKKSAVLVVQAAAMDVSRFDSLLKDLSLHTILQNNVYSTYQADATRGIRPYKVDGNGPLLLEVGCVTDVLTSWATGEPDSPSGRVPREEAHGPELPHGGGDEGRLPLHHQAVH